MRTFRALAFAVTATLLASGLANAQSSVEHLPFSPTMSGPMGVADELAELRARVHRLEGGPSGPGAVYPSGWCAGAQLVFVRPYFEEGITDSPSYDFNPSYRLLLGYQTDSGLGIRGRYWSFDHSAEDFTDPVDGGTERHSLDVAVVDLEITQFVSLGGFQFTAAGGVRYARFNTDHFDSVDLDPLNPEGFRSSNTYFEGFGPSLALDMRRPLAVLGITLIANGRGAMMFGDTRIVRSGDTTEVLNTRDDLVCSFEIQTGIECAWRLRKGRCLAVQALMEGQLWGMAFEQPIEPTPNHDDFGGFFGATLGLSYTW
jgi:hypothetical protein